LLQVTNCTKLLEIITVLYSFRDFCQVNWLQAVPYLVTFVEKSKQEFVNTILKSVQIVNHWNSVSSDDSFDVSGVTMIKRDNGSIASRAITSPISKAMTIKGGDIVPVFPEG
jgi:hypothetical protein